ncbi:MAG: hypothetical protein RL602_411, partial [Actinomycetota bacterium]
GAFHLDGAIFFSQAVPTFLFKRETSELVV